MKKVANFFKDARSIWVGFLSLLVAAAWAGDTRWVTKNDFKDNQVALEIRRLNSEIADLETKQLYILDPQQQAMMKALTINKKTQIKNLKGE